MKKNKLLSMMLSMLLVVTGNPANTHTVNAENSNSPLQTQKITHTAKIVNQENSALCLRDVEGEIKVQWPLRKRPIDLVVIQDVSGSFTDSADIEKISKVKRELIKIGKDLHDGNSANRMMVVSYGGHGDPFAEHKSENDVKNLTISKTDADAFANLKVKTVWPLNYETSGANFENAINAITCDGGTPTASGLYRGLDLYENSPNRTLPDDNERMKVFLLITDGIANVRLNGKIYYDMNKNSYGWYQNEYPQFYKYALKEVAEQAKRITDKNYLLTTAFWENIQSSQFVNTHNEDPTVAFRRTLNYSNNEFKKMASNGLHISGNDLDQVVSKIYQYVKEIQQPSSDRIELTLDKGFGIDDISDIKLVSDVLTEDNKAKIEKIKAEYNLSNISIVDNKMILKPTIEKTNDQKYDKIVFSMAKMPQINYTISYILKENVFKKENSTVFTGIANSYETEYKIPDAYIDGNSADPDKCEINPENDEPRVKISKIVKDQNPNTTATESNTSAILDEYNENFSYDVNYSFGTGISLQDKIQLIDNINENLKITKVTLTGFDPNKDKVSEIDITNSVSNNKIDYTMPKYSKNASKESYNYLEGKDYTLHVEVAIKDDVLNDVAKLDTVISDIISIKNTAYLTLTPKKPITPNTPVTPKDYPSNEVTTRVKKENSVEKIVTDIDENGVKNTLNSVNEKFEYTVNYYLGNNIANNYSIQLEDEINKGLEVTGIELTGNHLGKRLKTINLPLSRVFNRDSNKFAYRFPKVNNSYSYLESKTFTLKVYVTFKNMNSAVDGKIENIANLVIIPNEPNSPINPDPKNPNNPYNPNPMDPNDPNDPDPENPPTPISPDPNTPPLPSNPVITFVPNHGNVVVYYKEVDYDDTSKIINHTLSEKINKTGIVNEPFKTTPFVEEGFEFVRVDKNGNILENSNDPIDGKITKETQVYTYYYRRKPIQVQLKARKYMPVEGMVDGTFIFRLIDSNGNVVSEAKTTNTNGMLADVYFEKLKFNKKDVGKTFDYTIQEINDGKSINVNGNPSKVVYDENSYKVQISILEDEQGVHANEKSFDIDGNVVPITTITNTTDGQIIPAPPAPPANKENLKIIIQKNWMSDSKLPNEVNVKLFANNVELRTDVLNADNNWNIVIDNLDKKDADNNNIVYTVKEASVDGFISNTASRYIDANTIRFDVTNTPKTVEPPTPKPPTPTPPTPYIPSGGGGGGGRRTPNDPPTKPDKPDVPVTPDTPKPPTPDTPVTPITPPTTPTTPDTPITPNTPPTTPDTPPTTIIPDKTPKDTPKQGKIPNNPEDTIKITNPPKNGIVKVDKDGNWKYTPKKNFVGKDSFKVVVEKPDGTQEEVTVEIDVEDPPLGPVTPEEEISEDVPTDTTLPTTGVKQDNYYILLGAMSILLAFLSKKNNK